MPSLGPRAVALLGTVAALAAPSPAETGTSSTCVSCHLEEEGNAPEAAQLNLGAGLHVELPLSLPTREWAESVHAEHEVSCDGCHGGDPHAEDAEESMSEEAGFLENPSWMEMAEFCGACHEALAATWSAGRYGRLLREGRLVPTCASCHMAEGHLIRAAEPAQLEPGLPCPDCPPVESAPAVLRSLEELRALHRSAAAGVAAAEAAGIDLTDLRGELERLRSEGATLVHGFESEEILAAAEPRSEDLRRLRAEAEGWQQEAGRRRRFGVALLALLALTFGALCLYRPAETEG